MSTPLFCNNVQSSNIGSRREWLRKVGMGMGLLSLPNLIANADSARIAHRPTAKAKQVIHIFFSGGQSHLDTWDYKPELIKKDGSTVGTNQFLLGTPFKFNRMGKSGLMISDAFEKVGQFADDMAIINSMVTEIPAHEPATVFMNTGTVKFSRPSMGSWVCYGLGAMNQNLPAFVSLRSGGAQLGGTVNYGNSFLPGLYQGTSVNTALGSVDKMIENIRSQYASNEEQRTQLDLLNKINYVHAQKLNKASDLEARLQSFELAFKMQTEATDAFDIGKEKQETRDRYGSGAQGRQMLIARRLVERGVRFVQVWTNSWDNHNGIKTSLKNAASQVDGPIAALIEDLKQKGLLDSTLIIMTGEFGRTPWRDGEGGKDGFGRSHHARAFSSVLLGGGIKGGTVYGKTDDIGSGIIENPVSVHDLHATILHALGFDHTKLTYNYNGRPFRLTDVFGNPVKELLA